MNGDEQQEDKQKKVKTVENLSLKHTIIIAVVCIVVGFLATWVALLNSRVNNHIKHINQDIEVLKKDVISLKGDMKSIDDGIKKLGEDINEHFGNIYKRLPAPPE